ncbi:MAG: virulence protein RhuM/Fic/DOC family protein [Candidatus Gracilibacteria bacterium]|nr:virulence protein RhuM/Fic/DOC family protein [Candidatus Gracilibacteria bacterium]
MKQELAIYQAKNGAIELRSDAKNETIWANQKDIAEIFGVDRSVVSRHIQNIFKDSELDQKVVCAKFAQTTKHGAMKGKSQTRKVDFYNLDIVLAVGYRTNSARAVQFRKWATGILREHLTKGYTLNRKHFEENKAKLLQAFEDLKLLAKDNRRIKPDDILELVKTFTDTWFSLEMYDKSKFPKQGLVKKELKVEAEHLYRDLAIFKRELKKEGKATELFAQERQAGSLRGILGNLFQSAFGRDAYTTIEEKAAHLLYFVVKDHPFTDGNKRSGAFSFVWFLQKADLLDRQNMTPAALTALTLLIAESDPRDKGKMIGLVLLLLKNKEA